MAPEKALIVNEWYTRIEQLLQPDGTKNISRNRSMHEILVQVCHEGLRGERQAFGSVFAQVDFLCKRHQIPVADRIAIDQMRRNSNRQEDLPLDEMKYDMRALVQLISWVFGISVPGPLRSSLPSTYRPFTRREEINLRCIRVIVDQKDAEILVRIEQNSDGLVALELSEVQKAELLPILCQGMQLNLLDCHATTSGTGEITRIAPRLVVVEPDYLLDISQIAACFQEYGHHPLLYTLFRMKERANTQAILLGNYAGTALDAFVHEAEVEKANILKHSFSTKLLEYACCKDFQPHVFKEQGALQATNIEEAVDVLFEGFSREQALLEPSFVCEQLGIQGRVDLMTADFRLLVEQKSGRNMSIERGRKNVNGSWVNDMHYVQLLLYYGILQRNFNLSAHQLDARLLYSKYPPSKGLVVVAYYQTLFEEAIRFRNAIVTHEFNVAKNGFAGILQQLTPETLNVNQLDTPFFHRYQWPEIARLIHPLHQLTPLEQAYFNRMMTFVIREQVVSSVGLQEGVGTATADLWQMPLSEKIETGNILTELRLTERGCALPQEGFDTLTFEIPTHDHDFLPNFRRGDMVFLYSYEAGMEPDVRKNILYKGIVQEITSQKVVVHLSDIQHNSIVFEEPGMNKGKTQNAEKHYAIEHAANRSGADNAIRGLYVLMSATKHRRDLLLGQRAPQKRSATLSKSYDPRLDDMLLKAKQAKDYFLLVGPPGTGKTSKALRYIVEEECATSSKNILLTAYTNRAVDEICEMLDEAGIDFLRIGSPYSCDERFHGRLLDALAGKTLKLAEVRRRIEQVQVIVCTTTMLQSRPYLFNLKRFSLAVVDEASQILEPAIMGLLAAHDKDVFIEKFILIGDYKQLPAVVQQPAEGTQVDEEDLRAIELDDCRNSLFERLIRWERRQRRTDFMATLCYQGRMHPDLAAFSNQMFYNDEQLKPVPCPHQTETKLSYRTLYGDRLDKLLCRHRMIFMASKSNHTANSSDKVNADEAKTAAKVLQRIRMYYGEDFQTAHTVGVIVPYRNQIAMIRKEIERLDMPELLDVSIDTVERYQGSQRDVIIYSFTIQHNYQLEFLTSNTFLEDGRPIDRKLNVALTRARKQLVCIGNPAVLEKNTLFKALIDHTKTNGGYEA